MTTRSRTAKRIALASGVAFLTTFAISANAHQGATGVVKERMETMKGMADAMKALAPMIKGEQAWDAGSVRDIARTLSEHAGKIPQQFPQGSSGHPSEAREKIWTDWKDFTSNAGDLEKAAKLLGEKSGSGADGAKPAFARIVGACKSCHQDFREKKEQ